MSAPAPNPNDPPSATPNGKRRRVLLLLSLLFSTIAVGVGGYWFVHGRWRVTTDNAYVGGNVVQITPQVSGTVVSVLADDTDLVEQGQPLVRLDPADAQVQLQLAQANLADAVRSVRGLYANDSQSQALVAQRTADFDRAQTEVERTEAEVRRAQEEYSRRQALFRQKYIAEETLQSARTALDAAIAQRDGARATVEQARAAIRQAREQRIGAEVLVDNTSIETHPRVVAAAAKVKEAYLELTRATIVAPVRGYVAKRSVQVGARVAPGAALMAVIPLGQLWVDANFKESELENVRIGQPVELIADLYGSDVKYPGRVVGLAPGTGGAFALLPAQNATGNWIKIVQRVPGRPVDAGDGGHPPARRRHAGDRAERPGTVRNPRFRRASQ
ncbi:MAG: HlyD family efflux transporter periplasmic adaptor subunit [Candidatus Contendobacter sp.]|nr:HlyD family efflux transporter periplasmic adaptor subunit [Candidatus Contendobacter sp.]